MTQSKKGPSVPPIWTFILSPSTSGGSSPRGLREIVRRAIFVTFVIEAWYLDNRLITECVREVTASQDWEKVVRRIPYIVYSRDKIASA